MQLVVAQLPESIIPDPLGAPLPDNIKGTLSQLCDTRAAIVELNFAHKQLHETHEPEFAAFAAEEGEAKAGLLKLKMQKPDSFEKKDATIKLMKSNLEATDSMNAKPVLMRKIQDQTDLLQEAKAYRQRYEQAVRKRHAFERQIGVRRPEGGEQEVAMDGERPREVVVVDGERPREVVAMDVKRQPGTVGDGHVWKAKVEDSLRALFSVDPLGPDEGALCAREGAQFGETVLDPAKSYRIETDVSIKSPDGTNMPPGITVNIPLMITAVADKKTEIILLVWTHLDVGAIADRCKPKMGMVDHLRGQEIVTFETKSGSFVVPFAADLMMERFAFCIQYSDQGGDPLFGPSKQVSLLEYLVSTPGLEYSHLEDPCRRDLVYDDVVDRFLEQQSDLQAKITFVLKLFEEGRVLHPADDVLIGCDGER